MSHIQLHNLSVQYGNFQALNQIALDIPDRQIVAIIGPSGCGKTTLLKSMNRLLDLYEEATLTGSVVIDGIDIYNPDADILALRKKVGFLSQRPYPLPMSIYNNVAFGPKIHGLKGKAMPENAVAAISQSVESTMDYCVEHYLQLAGLWDEVKDRLHSPAAKLSLGQLQRLALARTLAVEPEVILADEPTSALDPISAKIVESRFRLLKQDYSIVVVTHILRQARRLADYVVFMFMGEVVEYGPAEDILNVPKDERTRAYISGEIS
ncbi:MAG: phosphate ABC transporter ATP-binding protein [Smithellaceae bacterium]|jgi:phosphate transport system ATP-binding protein